MEQKKEKPRNYKKKQGTVQKQEKKIQRGIFISEERHKGRGGRIKSLLIPNKIEVRMRRDISYLHESQVEWVEVARYSKKEGRVKRNQQKKQQKFKLKQQNIQKNKTGSKKYALKNQKKQQIPQKQSKTENQKKKQSISESNQMKKSQQKTQSQREGQNIVNNNKQAQGQAKNRQDESSQNSESEEQGKKQQNGDQQTDKEQKAQKNEQDDIVIVAEIKKEISNPFWKKPFVGVIKFNLKNKRQNPYKQKRQRSHISKIMDDFDLDFYPIHSRLPVCFIEKNNDSERLLTEYVEKNIKIKQNDKGGKIRNQILDQLQCLYALVSFIEWDRGNAYVNLVQIIGKARTVDGQCNCFLYEHELNNFDHQIEEQPKQLLKINVSPVHKQYEQMVFTIDPLTSTDLDDALSVRKLNETQYQFGIHISDVTSYLDQIPREELLKRTTSVYLPHNVFHMLPRSLVEISSLNPKVKRLAFSVFVRMNEEGNILGSRIQKNVIMSRFKLAYEQAQGIIKKTLNYQSFNSLHECTKQQFQKLFEKLKIMERIGFAHRKKRLIMEIFDNDEVKFELDEQKWPISYTVTSRISSQKIIQEFMIIGNIQTAKKSIEFDPKNSLIIHHPRPSDLGIRQFNQYFEILNYKFKFEDSYSLQKDLLKVSQMQDISEDVKKLCYFKARRVQETANYKRYSEVQKIEGNIHFALGLRNYTHFTSPMRRIADIIVHETLNHIVDNSISKKELLDHQIQQANWGRRNTKRLKRDLNQIYFCLMIYKTRKLIETEAIVSSFGCRSVSIFIPLFDMNKQIMWKSMQVDKVFKNAADPKKVDVIIYYDKRDAKKDIVWVVEKFQKIPIKIGCSEQIPLRLTFEFEVKSNKGVQKIKPKINY